MLVYLIDLSHGLQDYREIAPLRNFIWSRRSNYTPDDLRNLTCPDHFRIRAERQLELDRDDVQWPSLLYRCQRGQQAGIGLGGYVPLRQRQDSRGTGPLSDGHAHPHQL